MGLRAKWLIGTSAALLLIARAASAQPPSKTTVNPSATVSNIGRPSSMIRGAARSDVRHFETRSRGRAGTGDGLESAATVLRRGERVVKHRGRTPAITRTHKAALAAVIRAALPPAVERDRKTDQIMDSVCQGC